MGSEQEGHAHLAEAPAQGEPGCDSRSTSGDAVADADSHVEEVEAKALKRRRKSWGLPGGHRIGLALSGGGIRSATFSLGVLRELSALGLLTRFDYLSTVSGGTYIGSFFGGLFVPRTKADGSKEKPVITAQPLAPGKISDPLGCEEARKAIGLLRQSGRYLAPAGLTDYWFALTILTRNWLGLHLVIGSIVFGVALIGIWVRAFDQHFGISSNSALTSSIGPIGTAALLMLTLCVALGWSYWLTRRDVGAGGQNAFAAVVASILLIAACLVLPIRAVMIARAVALMGSVAVAIWFVCLLRTRDIKRWLSALPSAELEQAWDAQRLWITRLQAGLSKWAFLITAFAIADAMAFMLVRDVVEKHALLLGAGAPLSAAALVPAARTLLSRVSALQLDKLGRFTQTALKAAIIAAAGLLITLTVGFWSMLAYLTAWNFRSAASDPLAGAGTAWPLVIATLIIAISTVGIRRTASFLNLSSLATFYAGRLRRAYLGAGNPTRLRCPIGVEIGDAGDDIQLIDYYDNAPPGAPLHLIGVTLNQTRGRGSNIVQRDRHGRNITLGPAGISVMPDLDGESLLIGYGDERKEERLPLSTWIGISGASFSTGMGQRTGFGITTLAGLANVRLGYWWRAGLTRPDRSVQRYILNELLGRFAGTSDRRWYLSDGGHFDNTALYPLIRRKLPFILASDNGQDQSYAYEDLANLVRKARIDFGAEIRFLDADELDATLGRESAVRHAFGTLSQIGGCEPPAPGAVAALATIAYGSDRYGTLVLMKPRLTGNGPADLIRYKADNATFPQQSTFDQFFDEAQWESYYTLGRYITRLVMEPKDGDWSPAELKPLAG
jgi:hypothetical protein